MTEYLIPVVAIVVAWFVGFWARRILDKIQNRGVKVNICCKHGRFIPGVHRLGNKISLYSCDRCDLWVEVRDFSGKIDW